MTTTLREFQRIASDTISSRFHEFLGNRPIQGTLRNPRPLPFYQALSAITGAGKTPILADLVSRAVELFALPPVVLWLSKGRVVVSQAFGNLSDGGKYRNLVRDFDIRLLSDVEPSSFGGGPLILFATVGTFNQRDKERGDRLIFRSDIDTAELSTWEALKRREDGQRRRRPLVIVYDEGHNLSDQQSDLLFELQPDAFLLASATMRLPQKMADLLRDLASCGWDQEKLVYQVPSKPVVDEGLIKSDVVLGGYETPMATALTDLLSEFRITEKAARQANLNFLPKAIYVCRTNVVEGDALRRDDPKRPFERREAPPILIWRFLTGQAQVPPSEIAVYCDLDFDRSFPAPEEFVHYRGGDRDWDEFSRSGARHIIFNQALQEGWDDPACYFAYIDKTMGSKTEVEQVIGRVLRQPGAEHYNDDTLNTANFFVRVDARGVFREIVDNVRERLSKDNVPINVRTRQAGRSDGTELLAPKKVRTVPVITVDPTDALEPIKALVDGLNDYRGDERNTRGSGARALIRQRIGEASNEELQWVEAASNSSVIARWLFERAIIRGHPDALDVTPSDDPKLDARIELGSRAQAHILDITERIVETYLNYIRLRYDPRNPYTIGSVRVKTPDRTAFSHSLHDTYSGLNPLELTMAQFIDRTKHVWCRNPSQTGYWVPLITRGTTRRFFPDFIVWKGNDVFAIDTTGDHLLVERTGRKLLSVSGTGSRVHIRLLSEGRWSNDVRKTDRDGFTVWGLREDGTIAARWFENGASAVQECLRP